MEEPNNLERKVKELERKLVLMSSGIDFFSNQIVFKKKVKFNANVYDANGGVVTEINNL
jgi:hypothetical protein